MGHPDRSTKITSLERHRKKSFSIFPSPAVMSLTKLSLGRNNLYMTSLFPPRESLGSDIPAGEGNIEKLFLRCIVGNNKKSCKILKIEEQLMPLNYTYDKTKPDCDWRRKSSIQTRLIGPSSGQSPSSPQCQKKRR
jgi:hypothetical protein